MKTAGNTVTEIVPSEACGVMIEDLRPHESGYAVMTVRRKGGAITEEMIPVPLLRVLEAAREGRESGPLIVTRRGQAQTRNGGYYWIKRFCVTAGLPADVHPHSLRHSAITTLIDAGVPIEQVKVFARHADIRTTLHYYRRPSGPDGHGGHVVARVYAAAGGV